MADRLGINIPTLNEINEIPCSSCGRQVKVEPIGERRYDIPTCIDCRRRDFRLMLGKDSGLDRRHAEFTLERFEKFPQKTKSQVKVLRAFKTYDWEHPKSIYIYGPVGSGKTHLVCGLCHILLDNFQRVLFRTGIQILYRIRETFSGGNQVSTRGIIEWFSEAPFLVIDDLGAEKMTEWVRETFYTIVDTRNTKMLPTIVTTNYLPSELADRLDGEGQPDRIVSRLLQDAIVHRIDGPDGRIMRLK